MEKQLTLFGIEETVKEIRRTRDEVFNDYEGFTNKFRTKLTTDDCYTPEAVYDAVLGFVRRTWNLGDRPIVRPFYPGGDYENYVYPESGVVVDNPPFSILSRIIRFYCAHRVPFFLFGPSLTLFTAPEQDCTYIILNCNIIYANGAVVNTGFITNLDSDLRVWVCPELRELVEKAQAKPDKTKKRFVYPDCIITSATLGKLAKHATELRVPKSECRYIPDCDSAKAAGRSLFGGGFILSDRAAAERAAAERAAERAAAERAAATRLILSKRERLIIDELNMGQKN